MIKDKQPKEHRCMRAPLFGNNSKGVTVVEILVVVLVLGLAASALLGLSSFALIQSQVGNQTAQALSLAREQLEAVRNVRDATEWSTSLGALTTGTQYYPQLSSGAPLQWELVEGQETMGIFTRSFVVSNALRGGNGNITESGGSEDPDTKKVVSRVWWQERDRTHQVELVSYLTNWR